MRRAQNKLSQLNTEADANISASPSEEQRRRHLSSAESHAALSVERTGDGASRAEGPPHAGKSSVSANSGGPTNISAYLKEHHYNINQNDEEAAEQAGEASNAGQAEKVQKMKAVLIDSNSDSDGHSRNSRQVSDKEPVNPSFTFNVFPQTGQLQQQSVPDMQ